MKEEARQQENGGGRVIKGEKGAEMRIDVKEEEEEETSDS